MSACKKIMMIFPHPDDESFACGGTLALCRERGQETCLICVTSGCRGRSGTYDISCREKLARHREQELGRAAEVLGISRLELFRYPDGSLATVDPQELSEKIEHVILDWKPGVIITFPPDGVTGHPDHIATCHATTLAVERAERRLTAEEYPDLYYVSIPHYYDHCSDKGPQPAVPITGKVDISGFRLQKGEALRAHLSQVYSVNRAYPGVIDGDFGVIGCYEYYTLVRSKGQPVNPKRGKEAIPLIEF
ncbi:MULTISPECIES: PIG-L family deacetylase [Brevibacillus]|uniref:PIG-L deacetylase family protein n=1 Tax=Brevibacillus TaxID=55080 RepID=UPI00203DA4BD|nr:MULTISPECIES: PIG-L family deacetylase [Brevibacillus]MCM3080415.1 PIG-L family deacetylase [Brevibacillus invocatus]MCM3430663.1 PIG-L family deacetylase [Brevibacillus invocatus]MDH4618901.1 PIG-L family deacetylase [Brevibacillus sp. AY1]